MAFSHFFERYPEIKFYDVCQTVAGKPTFIKEAVYENMEAFCSTQAKLGKPEIQKVVGKFFSLIVNLETKIVLEIV